MTNEDFDKMDIDWQSGRMAKTGKSSNNTLVETIQILMIVDGTKK